jgi:hypothetical protein
MPDQSSAATEHAILQEITAPLETLPDDPVAFVHADFPAALRGYDRLAVDAYVQRTSQLVAELQATRSPEAAVRRALERVGEQISGILQRAHETAEEITAQSRREAEDRLEKSRIEAAEIEQAARQRVRDLDIDTDRIWSERGRIVDDARDLAQQLLGLADTAGERFPAAETAVYDDDTAQTRAPLDTGSEPAGPVAEEDPAAEEAPAAEDAPLADDLEQTVRFSPLTPSADDEAIDLEPPADVEQAPPPPPPVPADHRRSSSVIPPASQAANRRSSR